MPDLGVESAASDAVSFHRPSDIAGVELVSVSYRERSFPEHSHGEYVIGAVTAGAETLTVDGRTDLVGAGRTLRLHPDQPHCNATVGPNQLRYQVLYLSADVVQAFGEVEDEMRPISFASPVSDGPASFEAVIAAHSILRDDMAGRLEHESALGMLIRSLASEEGGGIAAVPPRPVESEAVAVAKAYIDDNCASGFGLADLAGLAGLSMFHFNRTFRKAVGLSPLAYRNQRRLAEARRRLLDGEPIAQVALAVGYADQSHLTRQFQRVVGASPRRYAQQ